MPNPELTADCTRCVGLCCVLLPFRANAGFGADKPGGVPCENLDPRDRCRIHADLLDEGWSGCVAFDCFGAGQQVTQVTYAGRSWRAHDNLAEMGAVFTVMRELHELLLRLKGTDDQGLSAEIVSLRAASAEELLTLDLDELSNRVAATDGAGGR
ncbi:MAG: hypothetical protein ACR2JD_01745 [Nocardioides sp.]